MGHLLGARVVELDLVVVGCREDPVGPRYCDIPAACRITSSSLAPASISSWCMACSEKGPWVRRISRPIRS